jgi:hypothetical protein
MGEEMEVKMEKKLFLRVSPLRTCGWDKNVTTTTLLFWFIAVKYFVKMRCCSWHGLIVSELR